jgi:hypothetical protein
VCQAWYGIIYVLNPIKVELELIVFHSIHYDFGFKHSSVGEKMAGYWEGKDPCWIVLDCSKYVHSNCPAYQRREKPCWELASTECKKLLKLKWECTSPRQKSHT